MSMKKWFCSCALLRISLCSSNQLKMIQQKVNMKYTNIFFVNYESYIQAESSDRKMLWLWSCYQEMFCQNFDATFPNYWLKNTEFWVEYSLTILCPEQQALVFLCNITTSSLQLIFAKNSMVFSHYNTVLYWETFLLQDWCLLFIKTNFSSFVLRCWSLLHFSFLETRWERTAQLGLFLLVSSDVCMAVGVLPGISQLLLVVFAEVCNALITWWPVLHRENL